MLQVEVVKVLAACCLNVQYTGLVEMTTKIPWENKGTTSYPTFDMCVEGYPMVLQHS